MRVHLPTEETGPVGISAHVHIETSVSWESWCQQSPEGASDPVSHVYAETPGVSEDVGVGACGGQSQEVSL